MDYLLLFIIISIYVIVIYNNYRINKFYGIIPPYLFSLPVSEQFENTNISSGVILNYFKILAGNDIAFLKLSCYLFAVIISILFYVIALPLVGLSKLYLIGYLEKKIFYVNEYKKYASFSKYEKDLDHQEFIKRNPPEDLELLVLRDNSKFMNLYSWIFIFLVSYSFVWYGRFFDTSSNLIIFLTIPVLISLSVFIYKIYKFDNIKKFNEINWKAVVIHILYFFSAFIIWYLLYSLIIIKFLIFINLWQIIYTPEDTAITMFVFRVIFVLTLYEYNISMSKNTPIMMYLYKQNFINKVFVSDVALVLISTILFLIKPDYFVFFVIIVVCWQVMPKEVMLFIIKIRAFLLKNKNKSINNLTKSSLVVTLFVIPPTISNNQELLESIAEPSYFLPFCGVVGTVVGAYTGYRTYGSGRPRALFNATEFLTARPRLVSFVEGHSSRGQIAARYFSGTYNIGVVALGGSAGLAGGTYVFECGKTQLTNIEAIQKSRRISTTQEKQKVK